MPPVVVLAPIVLPLLASAVIAAAGAVKIDIGRLTASAGAWATVVAVAAVWIPVRSSLELAAGQLGFGSSFDLRFDAVAFAFELMISLPAAVLITVQRRTWTESAIALLALSASLAAVEVGGIVLTAVAGGAAATLAVVLMETEDPRAARPSWATLLSGWLALAWVGVLLQVRGGTDVYSAVPVSSVTAPVFGLLALSAIAVSGLFPWRGWASRAWSRPSLKASGIALSTLYPLGFYLLVRGYEVGDGRYPHVAFNFVLGFLGAVIALAAGLRAQAAGTRREFFAQVAPAFGGFALMSIAIGSPLGLASGLVTLATGSALIACIALVPDRTEISAFIAVVACAGVPPGLAFGTRVLGIEAAFEGGDFAGLIGLAAIAGWAVWAVASARTLGLLPGAGTRQEEVAPRLAAGIALLTIVAGPALAAIQYGFGNPVAAAVMQAPPVALATRFAAVITTSSVLPVVALLLPLLVIGAVAYAGFGAVDFAAEPRRAALSLQPPRWWTLARDLALAAKVPEQYRSILDWRQLETAASGGRPLLWLVALVALAFAVTR